jgi:nucleoside-diphosphate-sugar epimerase
MILPSIGILGLGFLGKEIVRQATWPATSWGTNLGTPTDIPTNDHPLRLIRFDWQVSGQWEKIPSDAASLILTIPPLDDNVEKEVERLRQWGGWMSQHRPQCKNLVYISTTGVYPNQRGLWDETSTLEPETMRGLLRQATEKTLAEFFNLKVLRAGAIYGKNRSVGERILSGKPIPEGNHLVHRIHVTDLARIVIQSLVEDTFPSPVNVVDLEAVPTAAVAKWLLNQNFKEFPSGTQLNFKSGFATRTNLRPADRRFISNRRLVEQCDYQFKYPTYQEGLRSIYTDGSENGDQALSHWQNK